MKRKILALITAVTVFGSVSAFAATCSRSVSPAAPAVKTVSVSAVPTSASGAVQKVLGSTAASAAGTSASQSCKGSGCASKASCAANSCTNGTTCNVGSCTASAGCGTPAVSGSVSGSKAVCSGTSTCKPSVSCSAAAAGKSNCGNVSVVCGTGCSQTVQDLINSICSKSGASCTGNTSSGSTPSKPVPSQPATSSQPAPASQPASSGYSAFQNEVVRLVNVERSKNGLAALTADSLLMKTAAVKSQDMAKNNYFSHTSPTYGSPFDLMKQYGVSYRAAGENIAMGQTSPAQVMDGWMNSAGHRANILNSSFTKIGVGVAQNASGQYYWTQHFIG